MNDLLTPGRNLRIGGHKLKIAGDNPASGVWFAGRDTPLRIHVDDSDIVSNLPSELMIVIPELAAGTWLIEVVAQYSTGGGTENRNVRKDTYRAVIGNTNDGVTTTDAIQG